MREGDVVATLMWNNAEHVEAYFAVPGMGAVLHTLNLRLPGEQIAWIARHADDRVILVNGSLLPLLAPLLPGMEEPPHPMRLGDDERDYYLGAGLPGWSERDAGGAADADEDVESEAVRS